MDRAAFDARGFLLLRGILDPEEVAGMRAFLAEQAAGSIDRLCAALGAAHAADLPAAIERWSEDPRLPSLPADLRQQMSGHFPLAARLSPRLWAIARSSRLQRVLRGLLGGDRLYMHMPPTARFVLPGNRRAGVPAHQDVSYNRHLASFITVWTPLVGIDEECGGVAVCPGSGSDPEHPVAADGPFWLGGVPTGGRPMEHPHLAPGDALLLNPFVIHASRPNRSPRIRLSVDCRFFAAPGGSAKHHLDLQRWEVVAPPGA